MNTYSLIAIDYDGNHDELALERALGNAVVETIETTTPHWKTGADLPTYRFVINNAEMRNTVAHGIGCDYGFVCHTEWEVSA